MGIEAANETGTAGASRQSNPTDSSQIRLNDSMAEYYDSKKRLYDELIPLVKDLVPVAKKIPTLIGKFEQFFDTKSRDMIEKLKRELQGSLNFLVVKGLYEAGLVDKHALDTAALGTYGPGAPPKVEEVRDAGAEVLGNFGKPPGMM